MAYSSGLQVACLKAQGLRIISIKREGKHAP
jgi:hypothetical protein